MKSLVSTLSILLIFLVVFSLSSVFSTKSSDFSDIIIKNSILDRIYNKFISIEYGIERILEEEFNFGGVNVTIDEDTFNYVTFEEFLPRQDSSLFSNDLKGFENFITTKFNETNLVINLNLTLIEDCLPLTISPYGISYIHPLKSPKAGCLNEEQTNQRLKIDTGNSWMYVNGYILEFVVNSSIDPDSAVFAPSADCTGGNLTWSIRVTGNNTVYGPITRQIDLDGNCNFRISDASSPAKRIVETDNDPNSILNVIVQPGFSVNSSITLNLTDTPGKVGVGLPPQSIKVKETLYQIEKNDTIYIFGG